MEFKNIRELNDYINMPDVTVAKIEPLDHVVLSADDTDISDDVLPAYVTFLNKQAFDDYLKNNNIEYSLNSVRTVKANLTLKEINKLTLADTVKRVEIIDEQVKFETDSEPITAINPPAASWGFEFSNFQLAWDRGFDGTGVKVCVIDSAFVNIPGVVDFTEILEFRSQSVLDSGYQDTGHGNYVSSVLAAKHTATGYVHGVAPNITLYGAACSDGNQEFAVDSVLQAMQWGIDNGIDVYNFSSSVGDNSYDVLYDLLTEIDNAGGIFVAAGGNARNIGVHRYPASYDNTISVVGVTAASLASAQTNGFTVHEGAVNDQATVGFQYSVYNAIDPNGNVTPLVGTSFGSAAISGFAALIKQEFPKVTREEFVEIMKIGAEPIRNTVAVFPVYGGHISKRIKMKDKANNNKTDLYPVTTADAIIEQTDKQFVSRVERDMVKKLSEQDFDGLEIRVDVLEQDGGLGSPLFTLSNLINDPDFSSGTIDSRWDGIDEGALSLDPEGLKITNSMDRAVGVFDAAAAYTFDRPIKPGEKVFISIEVTGYISSTYLNFGAGLGRYTGYTASSSWGNGYKRINPGVRNRYSFFVENARTSDWEALIIGWGHSSVGPESLIIHNVTVIDIAAEPGLNTLNNKEAMLFLTNDLITNDYLTTPVQITANDLISKLSKNAGEISDWFPLTVDTTNFNVREEVMFRYNNGLIQFRGTLSKQTGGGDTICLLPFSIGQDPQNHGYLAPIVSGGTLGDSVFVGITTADPSLYTLAPEGQSFTIDGMTLGYDHWETSY